MPRRPSPPPLLLMAALLLLLLAATAAAAAARGDDPSAAAAGPGGLVVLDVTGHAPATLVNAKEDATEDALRNAVEQGGGTYLQSATEVTNGVLIRDKIKTQCRGFIDHFQPLADGPDGHGQYAVRVRAWVRQGEIANAIDEGLRPLIRRRGNPRLLLVANTEGGRLDEDMTLKMQEPLREWGFDVVSYGVDAQRQRAEAEAAAAGESDLDKAAKTAAALKADYFVVVGSTVTRYQPVTTYGVTTHPLTVHCGVQVIRTDTRMLLRSVRKDAKSDDAEDPDVTVARLTEGLMDEALLADARQIAVDWLDPLSEMEISIYKADAQTLADVVGWLRGVRALRDVNVRRTDDRGFTELTVRSPWTAGDLVLQLKQGLPAGATVASTGARIAIHCGGPGPTPGPVPDPPRQRNWGRLSALLAVGGLSLTSLVVAVVAWFRGRAENARAALQQWTD